jgi:pyruvate carboxylase
MYPKVFTAFAEARRQYGPVGALPTPIYFYGMAPGDEISVEIDQGKALVVSMQAIGDVEEDGSVRLFFELNGQPRIVTIADRRAAVGRAVRRIADPGNDSHIAAPMPGIVATLPIMAGQQVKEGDLLLTLEAMKMETSILAPRAGRIAELAVSVGQTIDAKDLLMILET